MEVETTLVDPGTGTIAFPGATFHFHVIDVRKVKGRSLRVSFGQWPQWISVASLTICAPCLPPMRDAWLEPCPGGAPPAPWWLGIHAPRCQQFI